MNKKQILKKTGLTEKQFYKKYPTRESYEKAMGGPIPSTPDFFNFPYMLMQGGGPVDILQNFTNSQAFSPEMKMMVMNNLAKKDFTKTPVNQFLNQDLSGPGHSLISSYKRGGNTPCFECGGSHMAEGGDFESMYGGIDDPQKLWLMSQQIALEKRTKKGIPSNVKPTGTNPVNFSPYVPGSDIHEPDSMATSPYDPDLAVYYKGPKLIVGPANSTGKALKKARDTNRGHLFVDPKTQDLYANYMQQFGGAMTKDMEGTYPMFNYGGYDPSIPTLNQFKKIIKKEGGEANVPKTEEGELGKIKSNFLSYIQNNMDNNLAEEVYGNMFQKGGTKGGTTGKRGWYVDEHGTPVNVDSDPNLSRYSDSELADLLYKKYDPQNPFQRNSNMVYGTGASQSYRTNPWSYLFPVNRIPTMRVSKKDMKTFEDLSQDPSSNIKDISWKKSLFGPNVRRIDMTFGTKQPALSNLDLKPMVQNTPLLPGNDSTSSGIDWRPKEQSIPTPATAGITDPFAYTTTAQGDPNAPVTPYMSDAEQMHRASIKFDNRIPGEEAAVWTLAGTAGITGILNNMQANKQQRKDQYKKSMDYWSPLDTYNDRGMWNQFGVPEADRKVAVQYAGYNFNSPGSPFVGKFGGEFKEGGEKYGPNFWTASQVSWPIQMDKFSSPAVETRRTLGPVPRDQANLEAEKGETAIVNEGGIPAQFKIGGEKHSKGGTPLKLNDAFIFSDTKSLKINDPEILKQFGMAQKKSGYTPAEIAKKYDINKYRQILADKNSTKLQKDTAEAMIANFNIKLAKLGLIQESKKGFPQGIPKISMPYIETMSINPEDLVSTQAQQAVPNQDMAAYGEGGIRGFSGNADKAAMFAADADTKDAFASYYKALQSGDKKLMETTANYLDAHDVPFSLGMFPWTKQDKLQDLAGILRETATKRKGVKETEADYAKKAQDAYNAVSYKYSKAIPGSLEALQLKGELQKLESLHPFYNKGASGSLMIKDTPHMYSQEEKEYLTNQAAINNLETIAAMERSKYPVKAKKKDIDNTVDVANAHTAKSAEEGKKQETSKPKRNWSL